MSPEKMQENIARLKLQVSEILAMAKQRGATQAEVATAVDVGFTVSVRDHDVESIEHQNDKGLSIVVYFNQKKGAVSTTDTSEKALALAVDAACDIARFTGEDAACGLADPEKMAFDYPHLPLYFSWDLSTHDAIERALSCEMKAHACDQRIKSTDSCTVSTGYAARVYGNSHGFIGDYMRSSHSTSCVLIAEDKQGKMQRDYSYTTARNPKQLWSVDQVAEEAASRTTARLGARRLTTGKAPVLFSADVAKGLWGHLLSAISGGALYRRASFLLDHLGKQIFPSFVQVHQAPFLENAMGSAPFDSEGVKVHNQHYIHSGILERYVLSSYSARRLSMETTGNAGGVRNVCVDTTGQSFDELLKQMGRGLLVTDVMGQGVNTVTGDYSRGVSGFWVENGQIQYPVEEGTIAGNLRDMFSGIVAIGQDIDVRGNVRTGSVLLEEMVLAGQ